MVLNVKLSNKYNKLVNKDINAGGTFVNFQVTKILFIGKF